MENVSFYIGEEYQIELNGDIIASEFNTEYDAVKYILDELEEYKQYKIVKTYTKMFSR